MVRPEGNAKVVFTGWKSLSDVIRETELSEYEKQLEQDYFAGFVGVGESALRTRAYAFENKEDYVSLPGDPAMNDNVNRDAAIVGVDIYVPRAQQS